MGETLGTATLELEGDLSGLEKDLATARKKTTAEGQKASTGFGKAFGTGVKKATVPALAALGAVAVGAKKTIDSASNLAEAQSAVNTTFGDSAGIIDEYASSVEDSFSKVDFLGASKTFAVFGKAAGLSGEDLAHFSSGLVFAAQDMASFHNADPTEVLENLRAGLAGETEPLRKYGILMNEAALNEFAWKNGIAKRGKELTEKQKVLAREGFILANLGDAQGDYARTAESAANVERRQAANAEDLSAKIGQGLMPAYQALQGVLLAVTTFMGEHTGAVRIAAVVIVGLAAGVLIVRGAMAAYSAGAALVTAATWLWNAALAANPLVLVVAGLVLLGLALVVAWKKSETFRRIVTGAFDAVKGVAKKVGGFFTGPFVGFFRDAWRAVSDALFNAKTWMLRTFLDWALKMLKFADKAFGWVPGLGGKIDKAIGHINRMRDAAELAAARRYAVRFVTNAAQVKSDIEDMRSSLFTANASANVSPPRFDSGGVMPGPRGVHRLALVAGGETILPTHKPGFGGAGGVVIVNRGIIASEREAVAWIKKAHDDYRRQNGGRAPW